MEKVGKTNLLLGHLRALDLTDGAGYLCGRILADLGADVIKVEKPSGDPGRHIGPFYDNDANPEKSLFWFAYNLNKRGITLNIETQDGRELFKRLVKTSDFVLESFPPGYMDGLGLGYRVLSQINPGITLTSISPFGQTGPYRHYKGADIVGMAMGGFMYLCGDPDRPPVRISYPQAYLHASAEAAVGTLIALYYRQKGGRGQQVDVSVQQSLTRATINAVPTWQLRKEVLRRAGAMRAGLSGPPLRQIWPCKDGLVAFALMGGAVGGQSNRALAHWICDEGMADDFLKGMDWDNFDIAKASQDTLARIEETLAKFFLSHTKSELDEEASRQRIQLYPVSTISDVVENSQLKARGFWVNIEHPELNRKLPYPGAFIKMSETPLRMERRAPLIGEHNLEIYHKELGLSREEMIILKQAGVI